MTLTFRKSACMGISTRIEKAQPPKRLDSSFHTLCCFASLPHNYQSRCRKTNEHGAEDLEEGGAGTAGAREDRTGIIENLDDKLITVSRTIL